MTAVPKPSRVTTELTAPVWEYGDDGVLRLQRCTRCGETQFYPRNVCTSCWSEDLEWVDASGTGTVWTYTVAHQPGHPAWRDEAPYVIAIVELDEGPRLLTNLVGAAPDAVTVGARVRLAPKDAGPLMFRLE